MENKSRFISTMTGVGTLIGLMATGCGTVRAGYDSPPYNVIRSEGKFELRTYPALSVVETPMAPGGNGSDGSFNRLFRFISGDNEGKQKIAMTTPVFMYGTYTNATMAFVMPAKMKAADMPKPLDTSLKVRELASGQFAVLRYSGGRNANNEQEAFSRLQAWMKEKGFKEISAPIYGYFDPPWTPAFLRRNEVMVRVESTRHEETS